MPQLDTKRYKWTPENRAPVAADDTLLTASATTMKAANVPVYAYHPENGQNAVEIAWTMNADAKTCTVTLFAARRGGDVVKAWTATVTAGKQVSTDSLYWVDTIATSTDTWITTITEVDVSGADRMSRIVLDTCGYDSFFCQYTDISSESIKAYYSGY